MIGLCCVLVIGTVAAVALVGRVVVIAVVAGRTVLCDGSVGPVQGIVVIVNIKAGRRPSRFSSMATGTIRCQPQLIVIGIDRLVEIRQVTGVAIGRSAFVTIAVASNARRSSVSPRKWKVGGIVIENIVDITGWVTSQTGGIFKNITIDQLV